jgi:hypothetical protein
MSSFKVTIWDIVYFIYALLHVFVILFPIPCTSPHNRSNAFNAFVFSFACPGKFNVWDVCVVTNEFYFSDWLFLYYLARNMEPYLFRQMLLEHIIPEIQSERNSMIYGQDASSDDEDTNATENDKLKKIETDIQSEGDDDDDYSLNSIDMENAPKSSLAAVNEKRVKFS